MDRRKVSSALSLVIRFFLTANALLWIGFWFVNTTAPKNMGIEKYNPLMEILYNVPIIFIFPVVFVFLRLILFSKKPSEHYRPVCHNWFFLGLIMTIFAVLSYVMTFNGGALISSFWRGILAGSPLTLVLIALIFQFPALFTYQYFSQVAYANSGVRADEPKSYPAPPIEVYWSIKQVKKLTLIAFRNTDHIPIFGLNVTTDGELKFVKTRGWDSHRIDNHTIILNTQDHPLIRGRTMVVLLLSSESTYLSRIAVLDKNGAAFVTIDFAPKFITKDDAFKIAEYKYPSVTPTLFTPEFRFLKYNGTQNGYPQFIIYEAQPDSNTLGNKTDSIAFAEGTGEYLSKEKIDRFAWVLLIEPEPSCSSIFVDAKTGELIGQHLCTSLPTDLFSISISPNPVDLHERGSANVTVTVTSIGARNGTVVLLGYEASCKCLEAKFNPTTVILSPFIDHHSILTVRAIHWSPDVEVSMSVIGSIGLSQKVAQSAKLIIVMRE